MANGYSNPRYYTKDLISCIRCREVLPYSAFHRDKNKYGVAYWCKACVSSNGKKHHKRRLKLPSYQRAMRERWIKKLHGISLEQYQEKLKAQDYICAICRVKLPESGSKTHLDHDHKTGLLRAFLCTNCNRGLGHFQDSQEFLRKAADYLDAHSTSVVSDKEVTNL